MKRMKVMLSWLLIAVLCAALAVPGLLNRAPAPVHASQSNLVYRLDFSDGNNLGKNTAGSTHADASVISNGLTVVSGPKAGTNAIEFPDNANGALVEQNYLSLPASVFENNTAVTIAGWFYVSSGIQAYSPEIGIFSPENNKCFRVDPYAMAEHGFDNACLYGYGNNIGGTAGGARVKPVYDGWRHVAYVMEGGKCSIYQNGALAAVIEDPNMSPEMLCSPNAVFYLGHSGYEGAKPDYDGKMSDIRVYNTALTAQQIKDAYGLNYNDFLTVEYTFDSAEDLYKENVRGYDGHSMREHPFTNPTADPAVKQEDGQSFLHLDGTNAFTLIRNDAADKYNLKMLAGHQEMTISMDLRIDGSVGRDGFERIWDLIVNRGNDTTGYMSACSQREQGVSTDVVVGNLVELHWTHYENGVSFVLGTDTWYNLTWVFGHDSYRVYVDGKCILNAPSLDSYRSLYSFFGNLELFESFFSLGAPAHEVNRLAADYDNVRIWAYSLSEEDVLDAVDASGISTDKVVSVTLDGETKKVLAGTQITLPVLENYGYRFLGWYDNAGFTGEALATVIPTDGAAYYPKWEKATYTITYDIPDGAVNPNTVTSYQVDSAQIVFADASLEGHNFVGWYIGETPITSIPTGADLGGDITLTAKFVPLHRYQLAFDGAGAAGAMETVWVTYDTEFVLPAVNFYKKGYHFTGWTDAAGKLYTDGQTVFNLTDEKDAVVTLTALWERNGYTLSFGLKGGEGPLKGEYVTCGDSFTIPETIPTKAGYRFAGWALTPNGAAVFLPGDTVENLSLVNGAEVILYARWVREGYTLTLNGVGQTPIVVSAAYREGFILSELVKPDGKLLGWATEAGGEVVYGVNDAIFIRGDVTLYAVYSA